MKIKKSPIRPKHGVPEWLEAINTDAVACAEPDLAGHLSRVQIWSAPKSDLHYWVPLLNRFDEIYERLIDDYDMKNVPQKRLSQDDKRLLLEMLRFSAVLLDNCANRTIYASSNHLTEILCSADLDVMEAVLKLILRLSSQMFMSRLPAKLQTTLMERAVSIARAWHVSPREDVGIFKADLPALASQTTEFSQSWGSVNYPLYRRPQGDFRSKPQGRPSVSEPPDTNTKIESGLVNVHISHEKLLELDIEDALRDTFKEFTVPEENFLNILLYAQFASHYDDYVVRRQIIRCRLLALACLVYGADESVSQSKIFAYEQDIVRQMADMIRADSTVDMSVQNTVLIAFHALIQVQRTKISEFLSATNASVNLGAWASMLRRIVQDVESLTVYTLEYGTFVDNFFTLLQHLGAVTQAANSLCAAGMMSLGVQMLSCSNPVAFRAVRKCAYYLDQMVYTSQTAFTSFRDAGGVDVLIQRIDSEIERGLAEHGSRKSVPPLMDYALDFEQFQLLKILLKFIAHMVATPHATQSLRNITESKLLPSILIIMQNSSIFGSLNLATAIKIIAAVINDEPTSYPALQDLHIPQAFLELVNGELPSHSEFIINVPQVIGALCLNTQGLALVKEARPWRTTFESFASPIHGRALLDRDYISNLGPMVEELTRHHPDLRDLIFEDLSKAFKDTLDRCTRPKSELPESYKYDSRYKIIWEFAKPETMLSAMEWHAASCVAEEQEIDLEKFDPLVWMDIVSQFLAGFIHNINSARTLSTHNIPETLIYSLSGLDFPYDLTRTEAFDAFGRMFRAVADIESSTIIELLFGRLYDLLTVFHDIQTDSVKTKRMEDALQYGIHFLGKDTDSSVQIMLHKTYMKFIYMLLNHCSLLYLMYFPGSVTASRYLVSWFASDLPEAERNAKYRNFCVYLGELLQWTTLLDVKLKEKAPKSWLDAARSRDSEAMKRTLSRTGYRDETLRALPEGVDGTEAEEVFLRFTVLRFSTTFLSTYINNFFVMVNRMAFHPRRNLDSQIRQLSFAVTFGIGSVLVENLKFGQSGLIEPATALHFNSALLTRVASNLLDDRKTVTAQTAILAAFESMGGIDRLTFLLNFYILRLEDILDVDKEDKSMSSSEQSTSKLIYASITLILRFFMHITTYKVLADSSQSNFLGSIPKEGPLADFEVSSFVARVRAKIFPSVFALWDEFFLKKLHQNQISTIIGIMVNVLKGDGEEKDETEEKIVSTESEHQSAVEALRTSGLSQIKAQFCVRCYGTALHGSKQFLKSCQFLVDGQNKISSYENIIGQTDNLADDENMKVQLSMLRKVSWDDCPKLIEQLLENHPSLTFDYSRLILETPRLYRSVEEQGKYMLSYQSMLGRLKSAFNCNDDLLAGAIAHLIGLCLHDPNFYRHHEAAISSTLSDLLPMLNPAQPMSNAEYVLLVIEEILQQTCKPDKWLLNRSGQGEPQMAENANQYAIDYPPLFSALMTLLHSQPDNAALFIGLLRLFVRLTSMGEYASQFTNEGGLASLLAIAKKLCYTNLGDIQGKVLMILRHTIENRQNLVAIMRNEIRNLFDGTSRQSPYPEIYSAMRNLAPSALRDTSAFIEAISHDCTLYRCSTESRTYCLMCMKKSEEQAVKAKSFEQSSNTHSQKSGVDSEYFKKMTLDLSGQAEVINVLLHEILASKENIDNMQKSMSNTVDNANDENNNQTREIAHSATIGDTDITMLESNVTDTSPAANDVGNLGQTKLQVYHIFLLQCLTELLGSYYAAKLQFLIFSKKGSKDSCTPNKPRSAMLNFFLNELLPRESHSVGRHSDPRMECISTLWTIAAIVALCDDTYEMPIESDATETMTFIRRFVLEGISRSYRETFQLPETTEWHFYRGCMLSDVIWRLIGGKTIGANGGNGQSKRRDETNLQNARLMIERKYISLLASALAEIDLNHPQSKKMTKLILRPLKSLTKMALKISETTPLKGLTDSADLEEISTYSSDTEDVQVEDDDFDETFEREETPDLFRHSSLGMFHGGLDSREEDDDYDESGDDDEMYDEIDFDDDVSLDDGPVSDDVDEENHRGTRHDMNVEIVLDDGMDGEGEDGDVEDDHGEVSGNDEEEDEEDDDDDDDDDNGIGDDNNHTDGELSEHSLGAAIDDLVQQTEFELEGNDEGWVTDGSEDEHAGQGRDTRNTLRLGDSELLGHMTRRGRTRRTSSALDGIYFDESPTDPTPNLDDNLDDEEEDDEEEADEEADDDEDDENESGDDEMLDDEEDDLFDYSATSSRRVDVRRDNFSFPVPVRVGGTQDPLWVSLGGSGSRNISRHQGFGLSTGRAHRGNVDHGINPLLLDRNSTQLQSSRLLSSSRGEHTYSDWFNSLDEIIGEGTVHILGDLLNRVGHLRGHSSIRLELSPSNGAQSGLLIQELDRVLMRRSSTHPSAASSEDRYAALRLFEHSNTAKRWLEEARLLYGDRMEEYSRYIGVAVLNKLIPRAIEEEKLRLEEERIAKEKLEKEEEVRLARADVDRKKKEVEDAARQREENANDQQEIVTTVDQSMEGVEPTRRIESGTTPFQERAFATIRGARIEITGLEIDPEFLEALPDDMREEVLENHIRERQLSAITEDGPGLSREFLDALPEDIRAELEREERAAQRRLERQRARDQSRLEGNTAALGPEDIDAASFLATLNPNLRQQVLIEQDEEFLSQLPPGFYAEANAIRAAHQQNSNRPWNDSSASVLNIPATPLPASTGQNRPPEIEDVAKKNSRSDAIELIDKAGIASLLKLLFLPFPNGRTTLHDVLLNVSSNRRSRVEIIRSLLSILVDGTNDLGSAERAYISISQRARSNTNRSPTKPVTFKALPSAGWDNPVDEIAQNCIQALSFLVQWNDHLPSYFLNEQQDCSHLTPRKLSAKKGKSKESKSKYPVNILLHMLNRPFLLSNFAAMEEFTELLSRITKPLVVLQKKHQKIASVKQKDDNGQIPKLPKWPFIGTSNLHNVLEVVIADGCSGRTFQNILAIMQHIIAIPGVKDTLELELVKQAKAFAKVITGELDILCQELEGTESLLSLSKFSAYSSTQTKYLRVLKTIDYVFEGKLSNGQTRTWDGSCFEPLWRSLSDCLLRARDREGTIQISTILLPLIESLLVICKNVGPRDPKAKIPQLSANAQSNNSSPDSIFYTFTEEHRKILNQMVRNNPSLMSGSFSLLVRNSKVLEFDTKRNYFNRKLHERASRENYPSLTLNIKRNVIFTDSYRALCFRTGDEIKYSKLNIRFVGEEGVDAGGLTREWFGALSRQMFNPDYGLFLPVAADRTTFHPNPMSGYANSEHLVYFKFIGRIIGKALYDGRLLDSHFSRAIYKHMLCKVVSLKDIESIDPEYYKSLLWILENDITNVITETFSVEKDVFGETQIVELVSNGASVEVTDENKHDYVRLLVEYRLTTSIKGQLDMFLQGFSDIIPKELVQIFDEQELELLISGLPDIDIDDWKNNTEYHNYTTSSPQIQWFWRALRTFDPEERAKLLQFVTGSGKLPLQGFKELEGMSGKQKFSIHRDPTSNDRLPQSHTCFNQLDLPEYESYSQLRTMLLTAISEGGEHFGFA